LGAPAEKKRKIKVVFPARPPPPADNYDTLTKEELQKLLKDKGMKKSGNKPELIKRLREG